MSEHKIAVIGAGLAGLTAAYRMHQAGLKVDLFEARNRVGGRVFSIWMKNYCGDLTVFELGAQNITDGGNATHLRQLASEFPLEIQSKEIQLNGSIYYNKKYIDFKSCLNEHLQNYDNFFEYIDQISQEAQSIGHLIDKAFLYNPALKQALLSRMMAYEGIDAYQQSIYHNIDTLMAMLQGGIAKAHEAYEHSPNSLVISSIAGGNARLIINMADILKDNLYVNKPITKIENTQDKAVITFKEGVSKSYDFVVLTAPASTYKNIDFSYAGIEQEKLSLMQQIGYGQNYKVALPMDLSILKNYTSIITDNAVSFFNHDETLALLYISSNIKNISDIEKICRKGLKLPPGDLCAKLETAKNQLYETYTNPVMHSWIDDIYALGSYSGYSTTLSEELDKKSYHGGIEYKKLFEPIQGKLFFAGEHTTILDCIGTMEAAVESGERAAKAILKTIHQ